VKPHQMPMPSSFVASYVHLVFSTKDRRPLIDQEWEDRLYSYLGGIMKGMDGLSLKIGGVEDHVHVCDGLRSKHRLDNFLRDLKGDSSIWIHKEITKMFEWQKGYGAFSVSPGSVDSVIRYIENQRAHHQKIDFKTEFIDFLVKAGIEYDERYLFG